MPTKLLIIDECLNKRIASELRKRGRDASGNAQLGYLGMEDRDLLEHISDDYGDAATLVTSDDNMPAEHAEVIAQLRSTLATIDPMVPVGISREQWESDVVHRWAHKMAVQDAGSVYRYSLSSARPWKRRKRGSRSY